jgi:hypothetical protein
MIAKMENLPLVEHIKALLTTAVMFSKGMFLNGECCVFVHNLCFFRIGDKPRVVIIGHGCVGEDARQFVEALGLDVNCFSASIVCCDVVDSISTLQVTVWTRKETEAKKGPYNELLDYDVLGKHKTYFSTQSIFFLF